MPRNAMISRSASGEGDRWKELRIHCLLGMTMSSARIPTPISQFRMMRIRRTAYAIGRAVEEAGFVMIGSLDLLNINISFIEYRQVWYRNSINERCLRLPLTTREGKSLIHPRLRALG